MHLTMACGGRAVEAVVQHAVFLTHGENLDSQIEECVEVLLKLSFKPYSGSRSILNPYRKVRPQIQVSRRRAVLSDTPSGAPAKPRQQG